MKKEEFNQQEKRDLLNHGYDIEKTIEPNGQKIGTLIVISKGKGQLHDSGYPYIRIFGTSKEGLVDLGWHDHYISYVPLNTDSFGKNIFHIMPYLSKHGFTLPKEFWNTSTFQIGEYDQDKNKESIRLS